MTTGPRRHAREAALAVLYLCEVGQTSPDLALEAYFAEYEPGLDESVRDFTAEIVRGTLADVAAIDAVIARHSTHWRVERLAVVDRIILRIAVWEMRAHPDQPAAIAITEAIELARRFSADEATAFVNGVLDAVSKDSPSGS